MSADRPPTHASLASPRIVNYETGKAGAKARSLWRLEPLRIRWVEFLLSIPWLCVLLLNFYFLFHFQQCSYFPSHLFLSAVSSVFFYFLPLPTDDLMLHCGLSVSSFLRFPPSFSFLLSLSLSDPGQPASQGCSLSSFHCTCCVKTNICHICPVFDPAFLNRNKVHN